MSLDIDECSLSVPPCSEGSTCKNTDGSFVCTDVLQLNCRQGYEPDSALRSCIGKLEYIIVMYCLMLNFGRLAPSYSQNINAGNYFYIFICNLACLLYTFRCIAFVYNMNFWVLVQSPKLGGFRRSLGGVHTTLVRRIVCFT